MNHDDGRASISRSFVDVGVLVQQMDRRIMRAGSIIGTSLEKAWDYREWMKELFRLACKAFGLQRAAGGNLPYDIRRPPMSGGLACPLTAYILNDDNDRT